MPGAACYGCDFSIITPDKSDIRIRMLSHLRGCEVAHDLNLFTEETKGFGFAGHCFHFKWTPGTRLVFIFATKNDPYAMACVGIPHDAESDYEVAKETGKRYLRNWVDNLGFLTEDEYLEMRANRAPALRNKPKPKPIPTGPHCKKCLKVDEGDLVAAPDGEGQLCMTHFIEAMR